MKIKSLCIVGGGSAGWMTAVALIKKTKDIKITLVESADIETIGVGEATQPLVLSFINEYLGFKETEWMPYCDATYKSAIRFNNFTRKDNDSIYHTFWTQAEEHHSVYDWSVKQFLDSNIDTGDYAESLFTAQPMCEQSKFSKLEDEGFMYAHHMDATKFGQYSKEYCLAQGIEHIVGTVSDINVSDSGDIKSLKVDNGKVVEADFFIDCTGFASVLLGKTLNVPFISELDDLPNDRAITTRIPYKSEEFKKRHTPPYTDSTAVSCGWVWNIPLWSRIGTGIVYSSKFTTDDEAEKEFKQELERRFGADGIITNDLEFRKIKMRVGQQEQVWKNNCLAIGLSAQFIEPLESTGLIFTVNQVRAFTDQLVGFNNEVSKVFCDRYNQLIRVLFKETKDFIRLHYVNTQRDDTDYWKFFKNQPTGDSLLKALTNIAEKNDWNVELNKMFSNKSWEHIVVGCGILNLGHNLNISKTQPLTLEDKDVINEVLGRLDNIKKANFKEVEGMLSHYDYLEQFIHK
jgi:hypothetical protein